ncbi:MAG: RNA polymerase subunit sigma-24 [bacterium]|nr:RNA polymerase subunit sigma-24 [bacterium]
MHEIESIYRDEAGRVLATLVRLLGDLDLAEEALAEAFAVAVEQWPKRGIPERPHAWLVSVGKFKAIDALRRTKRAGELVDENSGAAATHIADGFKDAARSRAGFAFAQPSDEPAWERHVVEDDQLRLIFYCCHPALPLDARIALALREVCAMRTEEIARAYLASTETIKKRITRAKAQIKAQKIAYEIPSRSELGPRLAAALHVVYLIYNEGYRASAGSEHMRKELSEEALYLSRELVRLAPNAESRGLLSLLLFQESRRETRVDAKGDPVALEDQDRARWNHAHIRDGAELLQQAMLSGRLGPYSLQAAIASVHALAESFAATAWSAIISYYDMLLAITPAPVIEMNRAIAVGMHAGPAAGLEILDRLSASGALDAYHPLQAARAEFLKRLGRTADAADAYRQSIAHARQEPELRYLRRQLAGLEL